MEQKYNTRQLLTAYLLAFGFCIMTYYSKQQVIDKDIEIEFWNAILIIFFHVSLIPIASMSLAVIFGDNLSNKFSGRFFNNLMSIFMQKGKNAVRKLNNKINGEEPN